MNQRYAEVAYYPSVDAQPGSDVFSSIPYLRNFRLSAAQTIYRPPEDCDRLMQDPMPANRVPTPYGALPIITLAVEAAPCTSHGHEPLWSATSYSAFLRAPEPHGSDAAAEDLQRGLPVTVEEGYWSEVYWRSVYTGTDDDDSGSSSSSSSAHDGIQRVSSWLNSPYPSDGLSSRRSGVEDPFSPMLDKKGTRGGSQRRKVGISGTKHRREERPGLSNTRRCSQVHRHEGVNSLICSTRNSKMKGKYVVPVTSHKEHDLHLSQVRCVAQTNEQSSHHPRRQASHREKAQYKETVIESERRGIPHPRWQSTRCCGSPRSKRAADAPYSSQPKGAAQLASGATANFRRVGSMCSRRNEPTSCIHSPECRGKGRNKPRENATAHQKTSFTHAVEAHGSVPNLLPKRTKLPVVEPVDERVVGAAGGINSALEVAPADGHAALTPIRKDPGYDLPDIITDVAEPLFSVEVHRATPGTLATDISEAVLDPDIEVSLETTGRQISLSHPDKRATSKCCSLM
uniref:Uncharacterized protein TCIL3000_11_15890 n=1 Tax=Trypanosoma congolense (strain IL3000) TaxID=1068625 RepID=G0V356_TRYCI|nr:unnamed protein product [Trypanosoma congolense IL3000]